jgi:tetratricopeptide (TPR) repeat protein
MALDDAELAVIFEAAERHLDNRDYNSLFQLLHPVADGGETNGPNLGRVYFYIGEALTGLDSPADAVAYYQAAVLFAKEPYRTDGQLRLDEYGRTNAAAAAQADGVAGEDEAKLVLEAGWDAIRRRDYAEARRWYDHAWDGIQLTDQQMARAAIGLAWCELQTGEFENVDGYLEIAEARDPNVESEVAELRENLEVRRRWTHLGDDGVALGEYLELNDAAVRAARDGDYETAVRLLEQILDSNVVSGTDRGRVLRNLGIVHVYRHDYDEARSALREAARVGNAETQQQCNEMVAKLDQNAEAHDIVGAIDLTAD